MTKKPSRRLTPAILESLECRTLMSVATGPLVHPDAAKPITPHVVLHLSRHTAKLGQSITFSVKVTAPRRLGTLAGEVEFFDGSNPIQASGGALAVPLDARNRASYVFGAGDVGLFLGKQAVSAGFVSSNAVPNAISKSTRLHVTVPKLKTASNGLETATVGSGHGKGIASGQTANLLYTGLLAATGQVFDYATADHGPGAPTTLMFTIGAGQVIPGFDEGTLGMKVGETRVVAIPSALGYGAQGSGSIPANADLVFFIKLLGIT